MKMSYRWTEFYGEKTENDAAKMTSPPSIRQPPGVAANKGGTISRGVKAPSLMANCVRVQSLTFVFLPEIYSGHAPGHC